MTPRQTAFVAEYLIDKNATRAAVKVGYSKKTAKAQGCRLLTKVDVKRAVAKSAKRQADSAEISVVRTLREIASVAFSDVGALVDKKGNLRPLHTLTAGQRACVKEIEVVHRNLTSGDGVTDTIHKIKLWDKTRSLEMLGKHLGLLAEKIEHEGELVIRHEI